MWSLVEFQTQAAGGPVQHKMTWETIQRQRQRNFFFFFLAPFELKVSCLLGRLLYHLSHSASPVLLGIFKTGSHELFVWDWLQTKILQISACQVSSSITGMSLLCPMDQALLSTGGPHEVGKVLTTGSTVHTCNSPPNGNAKEGLSGTDFSVPKPVDNPSVWQDHPD
jgi:hypothetical protein